MKIDADGSTIKIKDICGNIVFEDINKTKLIVTMKEGAIEIGVDTSSKKSKKEFYKWYRATRAGIIELSTLEATPDLFNQDNGQGINTGKICKYCGKPTQLVDSDYVYGRGRNYGMLLICKDCDAYVKVDEENVGKGRVANKELRAMRKDFHAIFDPLWQEEFYTRRNAYNELFKRLEITDKSVTLSHLTNEQARKAIEIAMEMLKEKSKDTFIIEQIQDYKEW